MCILEIFAFLNNNNIRFLHFSSKHQGNWHFYTESIVEGMEVSSMTPGGISEDNIASRELGLFHDDFTTDVPTCSGNGILGIIRRCTGQCCATEVMKVTTTTLRAAEIVVTTSWSRWTNSQISIFREASCHGLDSSPGWASL